MMPLTDTSSSAWVLWSSFTGSRMTGLSGKEAVAACVR
jgi:hypothetical protein